MIKIRALSFMAVSALIVLAGCAQRQDSIDAALALAEVNYPGQLELHGAHFRSGHFEVVLARPGDPFTRVRLNVDRDPAQCRMNTACEERLHRAYANGVEAGEKLRAVDQAFRACDVPAIAIYDPMTEVRFRTVVEMDLPPDEPQPSLDRLTECIAAFRQAVPTDTNATLRALSLLIVGEGRRPTVPPNPLTFEAHLPSGRLDQPSYMVEVSPDHDRVMADMLRLNPHFPMRGLNDALADAARRILRASGDDAHVPEMSFPQIVLSDDRLDVVNAYVLACSSRTPGAGPCRTDVAVRLRYDLNTGAAMDEEIFHDIRDARGEINLPDLTGR